METHTVTLDRAVSTVAWIIGGLLLIAGWIVYLNDYADLGVMLAVTAIPFIATAALMMIRCWAAGVCRVVRLTAGASGSGGGAPFR